MPGAIRPNKDAMKIAYKVNKTPKNQQQTSKQKPTPKEKKLWRIDSPAS
jgi:2-C-methyl-D-erythritol 4-phosphate cytidylyltransferase